MQKIKVKVLDLIDTDTEIMRDSFLTTAQWTSLLVNMLVGQMC